MEQSLAELAEIVNGHIDGDGSVLISGLAKIEEAGPGDLTFIANTKYAKFAHSTKAAAILVDLNFPAIDKTLVRTADPYLSFLQLAEHFYQPKAAVPIGVHPTAIIDPTTTVGRDCAIGAYVVVGRNCRIGDKTVIYPGVVIGDEVEIGEQCLLYANAAIREKCRLGNRVILQMGAIIGSDGFGFAFSDNCYQKIPQMGIVVLEDDVEIGANTAVDRATMGETRICRGVKLDNLIQIAHNVRIEENTAMAAQTGISGSSKVGKFVRLGGQVGVAGHIEIGDGSTVGAQSGVTKSIPANSFFNGTPAREMKQQLRELASLSRLPDLLKRMRALEEAVARLEQELHSRDQHT
ncbi:MAG TPA: UDP-3-O-(3-hydroxymyristoyl)glucosamine N-acyltransferase [bacterium]|jgi:UDP-3-O-[3-hydroxymyristoyl] glucosamine N-acyltransferase|nr:UDP-3-O-(3-hydroxymyristoyl)glucosamine N-acyltransferase [bacterium]HNT65837.1 UDP-3-O-(3-hydroxymyristoyl)glucosamine N-acyltransferase [bacterium]HOX85657.1 UDP-3-O-(3-hydroxymyristoyl)glucosamine N-acyltransferase [bacterium]HPG44816.1 UDP-3-O-(3-hydroxymyristoyl)glucosamine N-acyltransferase [bacterium]HPM98155.1 UDP-3-O-(3-hydroxymyristoyl)glucosamine N-acyltransferase [bacterium]